MKNSSFWVSLLVFILLMCSCKSKKAVTGYCNRLQLDSEIAYMNESVKIDTLKTAYFANEAQRIVIEEDITAIEYDKESVKPIKETKTKRKATQDSDKVVSKERQRGQSEVRNDSLNHIADIGEMVEMESKTVTESNGLESFGKWLGITVGVGLFILILYLWRRNKN